MGSYKIGDLVLVRAVTMLHPGIGRSGAVVDLPVQKDNLGFPMIFSSSLKGALKNGIAAEILFGPEPNSKEKYPAAIIVTDGFLVAFPARSLIGVYGFITSPILLKRLREGINLIEATLEGKKSEKFAELMKSVENIIDLVDGIKFTGDKVLISNSEPLLLKDLNKIVINEGIFLEPYKDEDGRISKSVETLERALKIERGRLLVVHDDVALDAVRRSLFKATRIRLERKTKTVATGGLWTEEYIPQWTIFYTLFLYSKPQKADEEIEDEAGVRNKLLAITKKSNNYLIIGGNETVGRGIVKLEFLEGDGCGI